MAERLKNAILGAMEAKASDIHISVGRPIQFRCAGELLFWNDEVLTGAGSGLGLFLPRSDPLEM